MPALATVKGFYWRGEGESWKWDALHNWKYLADALDPPPPAIFPSTIGDDATISMPPCVTPAGECLGTIIELHRPICGGPPDPPCRLDIGDLSIQSNTLIRSDAAEAYSVGLLTCGSIELVAGAAPLVFRVYSARVETRED